MSRLLDYLVLILCIVSSFYLLNSPASPSPVILHQQNGDSMQPTMGSTSLVLVDKTAAPAEDDVILYEESSVDTSVVHRVHSYADDGYHTKGDNVPIPDHERPRPFHAQQSEVIGVVTWHISFDMFGSNLLGVIVRGFVMGSIVMLPALSVFGVYRSVIRGWPQPYDPYNQP